MGSLIASIAYSLVSLAAGKVSGDVWEWLRGRGDRKRAAQESEINKRVDEALVAKKKAGHE